MQYKFLFRGCLKSLTGNDCRAISWTKNARKHNFSENLDKGEIFYEEIFDSIIFSADSPALRRIGTGSPEKNRTGYSRVHCLRGRGNEDKFYPPEHERRHIGENRHRESLG
jgi:hypothetical protein